MADVVLTRPLPTVLQPGLLPARRARVVSFSSASISESAPSSNPHSGESWFHVSASHTSHSSTSSYPPLPKGARPASPQPTRVAELDAHSLGSNLDQPRSSLKRSGTFSSWKLEWRGISKAVRWAVLGDKPDGAHNPRKLSSRARANKNTCGKNNELVSQKLDMTLPLQDPPDHIASPYFCASPTSPLSPSTSATCVDIIYEGQYSRSDLGDGHGKDFPISEVHFPSQGPPSISDEVLMRYKNTRTSRHENLVQELKYTNVRRAASELGHGDPFATSFDMQDTFSNLHRSTTSFGHSHSWSRSARVAQSDIGHSSGMVHIPGSAFLSTASLSYGRDHIFAKPGTKTGMFKNFRSIQSAIALPVSTACSGTPLTPYQRPRKLRKNLRAMPISEGRASRLTLNDSPTLMQPASHGHGLTETVAYTENLTAPLVAPKPRAPRKLKKRPSPALPPLPRTNSRDTVANAPPVPPKSVSIRRDNRGPPSGPESDCYSVGISAESPPALTDTSGSTSPDDDLHLSQDSSATSENCSEDANANLPIKRPSLLRTESNRRWTVGVADVPDDLFIEELERLRRMGLRAVDVHGVNDVPHKDYALPSTEEEEARQNPVSRGVTMQTGAKQMERTITANTVLVQEVGVEEEMEWLHARRAILCCRELVRTERSYQERLQELADGNVSDAVPSLLIQYLPALIGASKVLTSQFNEDMSASGVSSAFLNVVSTLERALVPWSGVVGEFFGGNDSSADSAKRKRDTTIPGFIAEGETHTEFGAVKVRCMSMQGHDKAHVGRHSSVQLLGAEAISASSSSHWLFRPAFVQGVPETPDDKEAMSGLRRSFRRRESRIKEEKERRRKPPFRDLAILPTQRVTRYVLLYKDLLKHTPISSPTRGRVEKAVETAMRLAKKCDRAQDNSTFLFHV